MKNRRVISGVLNIIKRLPSSLNGNPRYLVMIGEHRCRTKANSSCGYVITNYRGEHVTATVGDHYGKLHIDKVRLTNRKGDNYG